MLKLVYGCLAFSLIAGAIIFVSAIQQGRSFHGMTKSMSDALIQNAAVLDADRNGAVTQTGNGNITGYTRDLKNEWSTKFNPFEEGPNNPYGAGTIKAYAWCTDGCPNAILGIDQEYSSHGSAGAGLASTLTSMGLKGESVLSVYGLNAAFVAAQSVDEPEPKLQYVVHKDSTELPIANPTTASVDDPNQTTHAIVGSASDSTGFITRLTKTDGWKISSPQLRERNLRNACISTDGASIGLVSDRVKRTEFFGSPGEALGPALTSGLCTVDPEGITAVYTPAANPGTLEAARYSVEGKQLWRRSFGARRLLSKSGSRVIAAQTTAGLVTAIDAVSGRTVLSRQVTGAPFVAKDGSIITTSRDGKPRWLLVGKAPEN